MYVEYTENDMWGVFDEDNACWGEYTTREFAETKMREVENNLGYL